MKSKIVRTRGIVGRCLWWLVRLRRAPIAHREAVRLALCIYRSHCRGVSPDWKPLDTTDGVISQIDNMYAGVRAELEELRTRHTRLATAHVVLLASLPNGPGEPRGK